MSIWLPPALLMFSMFAVPVFLSFWFMRQRPHQPRWNAPANDMSQTGINNLTVPSLGY